MEKDRPSMKLVMSLCKINKMKEQTAYEFFILNDFKHFNGIRDWLGLRTVKDHIYDRFLHSF